MGVPSNSQKKSHESPVVAPWKSSKKFVGSHGCPMEVPLNHCASMEVRWKSQGSLLWIIFGDTLASGRGSASRR